jgi:hypothetical protein
MVATLGIVNVSADNKDTDTKFKYTGGGYYEYKENQDQTLFTISAINTRDINYNYYYSVASDSAPSTSVLTNWKILTEDNKVWEAPEPGKYHLYMAKGLSENCGQTPNGKKADNKSGKTCELIEITDGNENTNIIATIQAPATLTINIPKETGTTSNNPYYVVDGTNDITLTFTASGTSDYDNNLVKQTTKQDIDASTNIEWEVAEIKLNGNDYSAPTNALKFGSNKDEADTYGKLSIPNGLAVGVYTVTLKAKTKTESVYNGSVTKNILIVKVESYNIYIDGGTITSSTTTTATNNVTYGKNKDGKRHLRKL